VLSQIASRKTRVKYVATCHGFFKAKGLRVLFPCWGDKVIAISEAVKSHLVNDFGVDDDKVRLIYNGIDLSKFSDNFSEMEKKEYKKRLGLNGSRVVGIISRLSDVKGHKYLFEAAAKLSKKYDDVKILVVGDGPMKGELINQVNKLGIEDKVVFRNSTPQVARHLAIMDIFVMPTLQEGLGLSIIEAMAMSRPVIAFDVAGVKTLIKDNLTGLLVPLRDTTALKDAIERLFKDRELARRLAENGKKLILENFTVESMVKDVEELYKELLKK
jgi:glycosyltransferase involved in cell wall biosynthesis